MLVIYAASCLIGIFVVYVLYYLYLKAHFALVIDLNSPIRILFECLDLLCDFLYIMSKRSNP